MWRDRWFAVGVIGTALTCLSCLTPFAVVTLGAIGLMGGSPRHHLAARTRRVRRAAGLSLPRGMPGGSMRPGAVSAGVTAWAGATMGGGEVAQEGQERGLAGNPQRDGNRPPVGVF
jgi:hypothetical protein